MSLCDKEYGYETALKANQELPWQSVGASLTLKCHFKTEIYFFYWKLDLKLIPDPIRSQFGLSHTVTLKSAVVECEHILSSSAEI